VDVDEDDSNQMQFNFKQKPIIDDKKIKEPKQEQKEEKKGYFTGLFSYFK